MEHYTIYMTQIIIEYFSLVVLSQNMCSVELTYCLDYAEFGEKCFLDDILHDKSRLIDYSK